MSVKDWKQKIIWYGNYGGRINEEARSAVELSKQREKEKEQELQELQRKELEEKEKLKIEVLRRLDKDVRMCLDTVAISLSEGRDLKSLHDGTMIRCRFVSKVRRPGCPNPVCQNQDWYRHSNRQAEEVEYRYPTIEMEFGTLQGSNFYQEWYEHQVQDMWHFYCARQKEAEENKAPDRQQRKRKFEL